MIREIVAELLKSLFLLTMAFMGGYFGYVLKNINEIYNDEKRYKNVILRIALSVTIINLWLLIIRWDKAVNTVGFVGIYITLITLCSLAAIKQYKRIFMYLSIIIAVICVVFIGLDFCGKAINDNNELAIASVLGIILNIIAIVWSIHEPDKTKSEG